VSLEITIMIHSAGTAAAEGGIAVRVFSLFAVSLRVAHPMTHACARFRISFAPSSRPVLR
jgi:hypothetical protein